MDDHEHSAYAAALDLDMTNHDLEHERSDRRANREELLGEVQALWEYARALEGRVADLESEVRVQHAAIEGLDAALRALADQHI
jgi:hypothetical protein